MPEHKYNNIDSNKLKFKSHWNEAGEIQLRAKNGKLYPQKKENILKSISVGYNLDKIDSLFTPESVKLALQKPTKEKKDESKDSKKS
jgi:hypothetical protein